MKRILTILAVTLVGATFVVGQDPHKVGPDIYKTKLENERCRVFEITFKPGQKIGLHSHPDHVVYVLAPGTLEIKEGDKAPVVLTGKVGDTFFLKAQKHSARNVGKTTMRALVVELRK